MTRPAYLPAYILTGPRGIGKTTRAPELARLLQVDAIVDDDTGVTCTRPLPGALTLTHTDPDLPPGAVQFTVPDAAGLAALIETLRGQELRAALVDVLPYAEAAIGLTRDRWPHDSVILRAEAALADNPPAFCGIDIPAFLRKHGIHEEPTA